MSTRAIPEDVPRVAAQPWREEHAFLAAHVRQVLAVSGFAMLAFVVLHMLGNLLAFAGSGTFNAYARSIRDLGAPVVGEGTLLWVARAILAGALALHLGAHAYLFIRPTPISWELPGGALPPWYATLPTAWLFTTGALIAAFVAFHLVQLTLGAMHPAFVPDDPYHNLVSALAFWPVDIAYIGAALSVGAHLLPGIWTGMRSLRLTGTSMGAYAGRLSVVIPLGLVIGMSAVPVAVLVGILN